MPRLDKTGPESKGSKTGRGLGKCNSKSQEIEKQIPNEDPKEPAPKNKGCGRGQKMRRGKGSC